MSEPRSDINQLLMRKTTYYSNG